MTPFISPEAGDEFFGSPGSSVSVMTLWWVYPTGGGRTDGASQWRGGVSSTQEGARSDAIESKVKGHSERP